MQWQYTCIFTELVAAVFSESKLRVGATRGIVQPRRLQQSYLPISTLWCAVGTFVPAGLLPKMLLQLRKMHSFSSKYVKGTTLSLMSFLVTLALPLWSASFTDLCLPDEQSRGCLWDPS